MYIDHTLAGGTCTEYQCMVQECPLLPQLLPCQPPGVPAHSKMVFILEKLSDTDGCTLHCSTNSVRPVIILHATFESQIVQN